MSQYISLKGVCSALSNEPYASRLKRALGVESDWTALNDILGFSRIVPVTKEQEEELRKIMVEVIPAELLDRLRIRITDVDTIVDRVNAEGKAYAWSTYPGRRYRRLAFYMLVFSFSKPELGECEEGHYSERELFAFDLISVGVCAGF